MLPFTYHVLTAACCFILLTFAFNDAGGSETTRLPQPESFATSSVLQESFDNLADSVTAVLLSELDADAAVQFTTLTRPEKGAFLEAFWSDRNPFVLKYYYGYHLGRRRYSVSDAFFEQGDMIVRRYRTGFTSPDPDLIDAAARLAERLIELAPRDAIAHSALGYLRLEQRRCPEAEASFETAIRGRRRFAEARCGWALALMGQPLKKTRAFELFHETIALDPDYAAAYYARSMCHIAMMGPDRVDVDFYIGKLLERFPDHHDAHFKLGAFYEALRYYDRAASAYSRQLTSNPNHDRAAERLARVSLVLEAKGDAPISLDELRRGAERKPKRYLPMLAEALIRRGAWAEAATAFERYRNLLDPVERALYEDVSILMTDEEDRELTETRDRIEKQRLIRRFWVLADPTPTTPVNERRVEHYRRVYHARSNFAPPDRRNNILPFDRRGEIYVRFGNPGHQSWSDNVVFETDPDVTAVKSRLNGRAHEGLHEIVPPSSYIQGAGFGGATIEIRGIPTFPLPRGASTFNDGGILGYAWESWIYPGVGGGIELTFIDRFRETEFDFVDPPRGTVYSPLWEEMSPRNVVNRVIAKTPSVFHHDHGGDPMDLFVDTAHFRGPGRRTRMEVYTGVPMSDVGSVDGGTSATELHYEVALYNDRWDLAHRDSFVITAPATDKPARGALVVGQTNIDLRPGDYFLAVQVRDPVSGKIQIYRRPTTADAFPDSGLAMSSLELAGRIGPSDHPGPFAKGEIDVVPLPSHTFPPERPIGLYYEVYNLTRDGYGRTHYRVDYTVQTAARAFSLTSALGRLLTRSTTKEVTRISYDHEGTDADDPIHVSLNIPEPGTDPIAVTVSVTDLNAPGDPTAARTIELVYGSTGTE